MLKLAYFVFFLAIGYFSGRALKRIIPTYGSNKRKDLQRMVVVVAVAVSLLSIARLIMSNIPWHSTRIGALDVVALLSLGLFMGMFALRERELGEIDYRKYLRKDKNRL